MKLIVGLGNPGKLYENTRHNLGFMFVDKVVKAFAGKFKLDKAKKSEICELIINDEKVIFIKPQTFMNNSGEAVLAVANFYKIDYEDILVIYDDLDLEVAQVKIKPAGSSGGHKGMQSIIDHLHTPDIKRIRIGISKNGNTIDHVLSNFSKDERIAIDLVLDKAPEIIEDYVKVNFDILMNKYNHK